MIFKIFDKSQLPKLFDVLSENIVVGPVEKARDVKNDPLYSFELVKDFSDLRLNYTSTKISAKKYFLPYYETLCTFEVGKNSWSKTVDYNVYKPIVFFGMHACDINALNKLDKVLLENVSYDVLRDSVYDRGFHLLETGDLFIIICNTDPIQLHC